MIDRIFNFYSKMLGLNAMCTMLDELVYYFVKLHDLQSKVYLSNITLDEFYNVYNDLKQENLIW